MSILVDVDFKYPALILKSRRSHMSYGALGVARTLGRLGVPIYAVVEDSYTPLAASRYITGSFIWKNWSFDCDSFLKTLSEIGESIGHLTVLIPMDDLSAMFVAENAAVLNRRFLVPKVPWNVPRQLANKASLQSLCAKFGIPCPRTMVPRSADDVSDFVRHVGFPIVVKPAEQWRLLKDSGYNPLVIQNWKALFEIYARNIREEVSPMIIQEYIGGEDWIYHGYSNFESGLYLSFTGKKLLDYPAGAGSTAVGVSIHNEELCSHTEAFLKAISYSGICDIDWRLDKRDGQYKMLDCNPRIGLNFRIFETGAGIDVVRALHLNLTGRFISSSPMVQPKLLTVESLYFLSAVRGGQIAALKKHTRGIGAVKELAWWSGDDALPFLVMCMRLTLRILMNRLLRIARFSFQR